MFGIFSKENEDVVVKIVVPDYSCLGFCLMRRGTAKQQSSLVKEVQRLILVEKATTPLQKITTLCLYYKEHINYLASHKAKTTI